MGKKVVGVGGGGQNKSTNTHMNTKRQAHTHTPGTEIDQEVTNPGFVEISDFDEEEGKGAGPWCLKLKCCEHW
jgi:hypothetical protein